MRKTIHGNLNVPSAKKFFQRMILSAFYESGLTKTGKFSYGMADQRLLFNAETNDKNDTFGVDQGFRITKKKIPPGGLSPHIWYTGNGCS